MFTGCGTALITPFLADGSIDETALRRLVKRQIDAGSIFWFLRDDGESRRWRGANICAWWRSRSKKPRERSQCWGARGLQHG